MMRNAATFSQSLSIALPATATTVRPHILVVDDEPAIRQLATAYFVENDMRATAVASGAQMHEALTQNAIDVVLLDVRLGQEDGMLLARNLRDQSNIPIILVTGKREEADRVMGLELGADDYVTKPYSRRELLARVRAQLRRSQLLRETLPTRDDDKLRAYRFHGWELNLRSRRLTSPGGARVALSNSEFNLLQAFCAAPGRVLTRDRLLELSRLHSAEVFERCIDVQVLRLRRKIEEDPAHPRCILTERGAGYRFDAPVEVLR